LNRKNAWSGELGELHRVRKEKGGQKTGEGDQEGGRFLEGKSNLSPLGKPKKGRRVLKTKSKKKERTLREHKKFKLPKVSHRVGLPEIVTGGTLGKRGQGKPSNRNGITHAPSVRARRRRKKRA